MRKLVLASLLGLSFLTSCSQYSFRNDLDSSAGLEAFSSPEILKTIKKGYYKGFYYNVWDEFLSKTKVVEIFNRGMANNGEYIRVLVDKNDRKKDRLLESRNIDYRQLEIRELADF